MKMPTESPTTTMGESVRGQAHEGLFICRDSSVNTEMTEMHQPRGCEWLFYDGSCRYCTATARWFERALKRRGIGIAPLQGDWSLATLNLSPAEALDEMRFLDSIGQVYGGA